MKNKTRADSLMLELEYRVAEEDLNAAGIMNLLFERYVEFPNRTRGNHFVENCSEWVYSVRKWSNRGFTDRELGKEKIIPSEIGLPEISNQVTKKKIGRNDPCPCGSGKKYKHCCGKIIDYIARKTRNTRADVVNALGKKRLEKIYDLADVYHSDNIERVSDDFIREADIESGNFDNVKDCSYSIPSHWDIGKVYKRLIKEVAKKSGIETIDALIEVYNSFISPKIDDYNSSMYYENPSYLSECYFENKVI